ncbi:MAG: hypothetical protein COW08_01295 [Ignavibacteriales bacterium CG12_big_fil_rev_8_21_14_0_65_30_8]|nr:MAG: hypothetical protein COW08_01295 [Ignavibacteriales bacterium CG12_big_fil_rev_8_21_14_0_65_30_8]
MKTKEKDCMHECKDTCSSLNEALRKEAAIARYYENMIEQCNMPDVKSLINDLIEDKRSGILRIIKKLNEIHARSQVIDGISNSFNQTAI